MRGVSMCEKRNVLRYLEHSYQAFPDKKAVIDEKGDFTYREFIDQSKRIGTWLSQRGLTHKGVIIAMEKGRYALSAMFGSLYSANYYVPIDLTLPQNRFKAICDELNDAVLIVDEDFALDKYEVPESITVVHFKEICDTPVDDALLAQRREAALSTDVAYVLFTSGSTGTPKGVAISHEGIVSFIDSFIDEFEIAYDDIIGNQAPFDFDISTKDIYSSIATGATLVAIPRRMFMQPVSLVDYLEQHKVTVMVWAVAALCIVSSYKALVPEKLKSIRLIMFSGEVMPAKHLKMWMKALPEAQFVNLYGPTEITCNCLFYKIERNQDYKDGIPLGRSFNHCDVIILSDDDKEITTLGETGEIIVRGPSVALGYLGLREDVMKVFSQNPLHKSYPDRVYHTGDLAAYAEDGQLYFKGRKDNQIKHLGHRIELEEIDIAFSQFDGVTRAFCVYDERKSRLRLFYEGEAEEKDLLAKAKSKLPFYMHPSSVYKMDEIPLSKHGKVDRKKLLESVTR